jgi:hypothetical protein
MSPRQLRPQTRRVDRGRNHEYFLDGTKCDGVTTLLSGGVPKPALTAWAARSVAEFVASRRGILTELGDDELIDLCKGVPFRDRDKAANRGTEVHALAARLGAGEQNVTVPEELLGPVDAYIAWEAAWSPTNVRTELTVINRRYRYMGTLDWLGELQDLGTTLLDIKTSRSGIFAETGLQAIAYGSAESILNDDGSEEPMPHVETYAALWLTPDDFQFYVLHVDERDFRAFLYAAQTARWIKERAGDRAPRPVVSGALIPPTTKATLSIVKEATA